MENDQLEPVKPQKKILKWAPLLMLLTYFVWLALGGAQDRLVPLPFFPKDPERTTAIWDMKEIMGKIETKAQQDSLYEIDKYVAIHTRKFILDYKASFLDQPYEYEEITKGFTGRNGGGSRRHDFTIGKDWSNYDLRGTYGFQSLVGFGIKVRGWRWRFETFDRLSEQFISINKKLGQVPEIIADNLSLYGRQAGENANLDTTFLRRIALGEEEGYQAIPYFTEEVKNIKENFWWLSFFLSEAPRVRAFNKTHPHLKPETYQISRIPVSDQEKETIDLLQHGNIYINHLHRIKLEYYTNKKNLYLWAEVGLNDVLDIKNLADLRSENGLGKGTVQLELSMDSHSEFNTMKFNNVANYQGRRRRGTAKLKSCLMGQVREIKEEKYSVLQPLSHVYFQNNYKLDEVTETVQKAGGYTHKTDMGVYYIVKGRFFDGHEDFCDFYLREYPEIATDSCSNAFWCHYYYKQQGLAQYDVLEKSKE